MLALTRKLVPGEQDADSDESTFEQPQQVAARGLQVTVLTAARLPVGYTRCYLKRTQPGIPPLLIYEGLIPPEGTTSTSTPMLDEEGSTLITFDLTAARPLPRPGQKPLLGAVVATTAFRVASCARGASVSDPAAGAGLVDSARARMSPLFDEVYAAGGRAIPPDER